MSPSAAVYNGRHEPLTLQVVTGRHHRHRKTGPSLADRADQLSTHLLDCREHMLDPGTSFGDAVVAQLLAGGQRLVALAFSLDLVPEAIFLEPRFAMRRRIQAGKIGKAGDCDDAQALLAVRLGCGV